MADTSILSDFGINILEEEIDDVIFQTNEFLCDATFTGSQGSFWWILQMSMALAALFSIIIAAGMAYKMMVKHEPLDIMKRSSHLSSVSFSVGGTHRQTQALHVVAAAGASSTFSAISRTVLAPIPMTSMKQSPSS